MEDVMKSIWFVCLVTLVGCNQSPTPSAEQVAKWALDAQVVDNCKQAIRAKADATTLDFPQKMGFDVHPIENGFALTIQARDASGLFDMKCYTDGQARVTRLLTSSPG